MIYSDHCVGKSDLQWSGSLAQWSTGITPWRRVIYSHYCFEKNNLKWSLCLEWSVTITALRRAMCNEKPSTVISKMRRVFYRDLQWLLLLEEWSTLITAFRKMIYSNYCFEKSDLQWLLHWKWSTTISALRKAIYIDKCVDRGDLQCSSSWVV